MTIEKIDTSDIILREHLAAKINEIIDDHNRLVERYENHYHDYLNIPEEGNKTSYPVAGIPRG